MPTHPSQPSPNHPALVFDFGGVLFDWNCHFNRIDSKEKRI
jgi:hypothetical protein